MNHKPLAALFVTIVFFILLCSGCIDTLFDSSTRYQSYPTSVSYTISYGYDVDVSGEGTYTLTYLCDYPQVVSGIVSSRSVLYPQDYEEVSFGKNNQVKWTIKSEPPQTYQLGVTATVQSSSFLVSDLTGAAALSIQDIAVQYPDFVQDYCQGQSVGDTKYIDPSDPEIYEIATDVYTDAAIENSFLVSKALFVWLKEHTEYQSHGTDTGVQSAVETCQITTGDCDDLSFLYISLCRAVGIPARFIRGLLLENLSLGSVAGPHAWVEVFVGGPVGNQGWIPIECACNAQIETELHQNFGVEDALHLRLFVDQGSNESLNRSLSSISWSYTSSVDVTAHSFIEITDYTVLNSQQLVITKENQRSYQ